MQKDGAANDPINAVNLASAADNINQIREILFGGERRALEQRLDELEQRLRESEHAWRDGLEAAVQALRTHAADQAEQLLEALTTERATRARFAADLSLQMDGVNQTFAQRLDHLESALNEDLQRAHHQMEQQLQDLASRIAAEQAAIARQVEATEQRLQTDKVDTAKLSQIFEALAGQLRADSNAEPPA